MKHLDKFMRIERFDDVDGGGDCLEVSYDNRGEPYREGIILELRHDRLAPRVFLEKVEALRLRALIDCLFPPKVSG